MTIETRAAVGSIEFRDAADGAKPGFTARAVNYGVRDSYGTSWAPGVFKESLEARMPPVVWGHDWNDPIGRVVGYREVERRGQGDPGGLEIDVELDDLDAVPRARQAYAQLKSGTMSQFSFGFERQADQADPELRNTTRITRARVQEFSLVLNGAVPGTKPLAIRSQEATIDTRAASDLITRFAAGQIELSVALAELNGKRQESPQFEFRALSEETDPEAATKTLADVDKAMADVAGALSRDDMQAATRYFYAAASRLESLLYLLGKTPSTGWAEGWRQRQSDEVRDELPDELPDELVGPAGDDEDFERALARLERRANVKKPYGDVAYADPGYQKDGKKRYPLDTKEHVRAAWSYVNMPKNAKAYSADQLSSIKGKIRAAAKKLGIEISE